MKYRIYEGYMPELEKKMQRIERKCNRYGCEFSYSKLGEEFEDVQDTEGNNHTVKYIIIDVNGNAVINDWEFIGSVEHTAAGNIFRKAMADVEIPERYRNSDPYCEHCHTHRRRNETYIIHNVKTGDFKQVGKSCLRDYTFGYDAALAAHMMAMKAIFEEYEEREIGGSFFSSNAHNYINKMDALKMAIEVVDKFGYAKADADYSTRDRVLDILFIHRVFPEVRKQIKRELEAVSFNADRAEHEATANDMLEWISNADASNDYMHNLKVVSQLEYINAGQVGILVSLIPTYNRAMNIEQKKREQKKQDAKSEFVGNVKGRIKAEIKECGIVTSWENCYNGYDVELVFMYRFIDTNDNIYIWKTAKSIDVDNVKSLTGTIKEHSEYKGTKQNIVTRCKVA